MKSIALAIACFGLIGSMMSFASVSSTDLKFEATQKSAFKTEGACMSRLLDKAPRIATKESCRLG